MEKFEFEVQGLQIYDPRDEQWKVSDNPALVFACLAQRQAFIHSMKLDDRFWGFIKQMADYCDKPE